MLRSMTFGILYTTMSSVNSASREGSVYSLQNVQEMMALNLRRIEVGC